MRDRECTPTSRFALPVSRVYFFKVVTEGGDNHAEKHSMIQTSSVRHGATTAVDAEGDHGPRLRPHDQLRPCSSSEQDLQAVKTEARMHSEQSRICQRVRKFY